ncbi:MAG: hypothetical protein IPJ48_17385 [Propionivibrio sp.]|uniref:Uncharacterized protein n=1 Tax=Candidatus Propionivibrio dominans TaxID=2954373 RepID=A0A9D7F9K1_9RHOO|nr:hypothetical protein [Candidatus Propionivibrio dominans]
MATSYKKDPNAILDYTFDWGPYLTAISDTISSVTWVVSSGITTSSPTNTTTTATVFVTGGVLDTTETLTCRITTAGGRTDDRTISLKIVNR